MPRYIDIEPIEKAAHDYGYSVVSIALINKQPTADVPERKAGEWLSSRPDAPMFGFYYCSLCGRKRTSPQDNYCPNCGAEMKGDSDG